MALAGVMHISTVAGGRNMVSFQGGHGPKLGHRGQNIKSWPFMGDILGGQVPKNGIGARGQNMRSFHGGILGGQGPKYGVLSWGPGPKYEVLSWGHFGGQGPSKNGILSLGQKAMHKSPPCISTGGLSKSPPCISTGGLKN